jgi:hypothetical protein
MLESLRYFDESKVAKQRLEIIEMYDKYGEKITKRPMGQIGK